MIVLPLAFYLPVLLESPCFIHFVKDIPFQQGNSCYLHRGGFVVGGETRDYSPGQESKIHHILFYSFFFSSPPNVIVVVLEM